MGRVRYASKNVEPKKKQSADSKPKRKWWMLPLVLPYLALCFPQLYARATPVLFGFPFFYWYQFLWVILTSTILALVARKLKV
jgi:hypothetical protein